MKISYEFKGHKLEHWGEYGGLPVKTVGGYESRLVFIKEDIGVMIEENSLSCFSTNCHVDNILLRYSKLEDVIEKAPEWATHFYVARGRAKGRFWQIINGVNGYSAPIKGHLFKSEEYPEPVDLKEQSK